MFELKSGQAKCVSENIRKNSMTLGNYSILNPYIDQLLPDSHTVSVRVSWRSGNNDKLYHQNEHVQSGQFAFVAIEDGDYIACFWIVHHKPQTTLTIDLDWRTGVAAQDWSNVAKKSHIDTMVRELQILQEVVSSIHEETIYLRKQTRNGTAELDNQLQFVVVEFAFTVCLHVSSGAATTTLEDLLREKENPLKFYNVSHKVLLSILAHLMLEYFIVRTPSLPFAPPLGTTSWNCEEPRQHPGTVRNLDTGPSYLSK
ncbi:unnamed protein product [Sphenostylis stenocarpa]|uniref:GOLD domain-containing protein n=1 Tax=Sphenostylis stenocarpa TaxID=92480 RepID=A0AA86RW57_9FABA|nr:unnamed protein product [Sphenostylis stenocarpa]